MSLALHVTLRFQPVNFLATKNAIPIANNVFILETTILRSPVMSLKKIALKKQRGRESSYYGTCLCAERRQIVCPRIGADSDLLDCGLSHEVKNKASC